ncbi:MAG: hypothetical protein M1828_007451 [Chrysothrix sp. TS-e1954]|nr:MAG: hypothetical protein M1828_007451 [Chrysothrix sp. TS-e1954]
MLTRTTDKASPEARAVRRELFSRVRDDWSFPSQRSYRSQPRATSPRNPSYVAKNPKAAPGIASAANPATDFQWIADDYKRDVEDVIGWRERTFASSDASSGSDSAWASEDEGEDMNLPCANQDDISKGVASNDDAAGTPQTQDHSTKSPSRQHRKPRRGFMHARSHRARSNTSRRSSRGDTNARRNRRRKARLDEEMTWNDGLAHWAARRDAWCCAVLIPDRTSSRSSADHPAPPPVEKAGASSITLASSSVASSSNATSADGTSSREEPPDTPPTPNSIDYLPRIDSSRAFATVPTELLPPDAASAAAAPAALKGEDSGLNDHVDGSNHTQATSEPSHQIRPPRREPAKPGPTSTTAQTPTTSLLPIPPPLLPTLPTLTTTNPPTTTSFLSPPIPTKPLPSTTQTQTTITPLLYPTIYRKLVLQQIRPSIPINLSHMTSALVQGWVEDGEWPESAAPVGILENIRLRERERQRGRGRRGVVAAAGAGGVGQQGGMEMEPRLRGGDAGAGGAGVGRRLLEKGGEMLGGGVVGKRGHRRGASSTGSGGSIVGRMFGLKR